jgi:hypothetical protein
MAIARVDRVADRLDDFAESGGTGLREALTGRPTQQKKPRATGTLMRARMGGDRHPRAQRSTGPEARGRPRPRRRPAAPGGSA